jgi:hypothetical protein
MLAINAKKLTPKKLEVSYQNQSILQFSFWSVWGLCESSQMVS